MRGARTPELVENRDQAFVVDGLREIFHGAQRIAHLAVLQHRDHDDRNRRRQRIRFEFAQHRPPVLARHHHVKRDGIRRSTACERHPLNPVGGAEHLVADFLELALQQRARVDVIVDDQHQCPRRVLRL